MGAWLRPAVVHGQGVLAVKRPNRLPWLGGRWRGFVVALSVVGPLALLFSWPRIPQSQEYYDFADQRAFLGIPNFLDVAAYGLG